MRMFIKITLLLSLSSPAFAQRGDVSLSAPAARIQQYVYDLADDSMMGRVTGTREHVKAAKYVAQSLRTMGIRPAFYDAGAAADGYFHEFHVEADRLGDGPVRTFNVVGIVDGADPARRHEYVVVGAHLDHVGWPDESQVYNGASDNASGVATVLEVAGKFAADPPPQSILFAFYSGEELGKLGSLAFVELMDDADATLLVNVNVDDVGHLEREPSGAPIIGLLHGNLNCPRLIDTALEIGQALDLAVTDLDRKKSFTRSDHFSFFAAGLPVLFFTSGFEYEEYHQPTDVPSTLDYSQLARVAELADGVVRAVANNSASCTALSR